MMGYLGQNSIGWAGFGLLGFILMILFWALIIAAIVAFVRWLIHPTRREFKGSGEKTALDILKERYAKGEIDKKEYEEKMKDIKD